MSSDDTATTCSTVHPMMLDTSATKSVATRKVSLPLPLPLSLSGHDTCANEYETMGLIASALLDGIVQGVVVQASAEIALAAALAPALDVATSAMLFCNPLDGWRGNRTYTAVLVWSSYSSSASASAVPDDGDQYTGLR